MKKILFVFLALSLLLAGCAPSVKPDAAQNGIEISQAKIVLPGGNAMGGAGMSTSLGAFMSIKNTNPAADQLVGVSTDAADAAIHETVMDNNVMKMQEIPSLDIPANGIAELKHGGYHIMLTNLKKDLKVGDTVTLTLTFKNAGKITLSIKVTDQ